MKGRNTSLHAGLIEASYQLLPTHHIVFVIRITNLTSLKRPLWGDA
jgi:hypothetical protein